MFSIEVVERDPSPVRNGDYLGRIRFGDFTERFAVAAGYWSPGDYERSWHRSLHKLVCGADAVALMSSMHKPGTDRPFRAWIGFRDGSVVRFQDVLLLPGTTDLRFSDDDSLLKLPERRTIAEGGDAVSEWSVALGDVEIYLSGQAMQ